MARKDYEHHNEEADRIWWEEEGKHQGMNEPDPDRFDDLDDYQSHYDFDDEEDTDDELQR